MNRAYGDAMPGPGKAETIERIKQAFWSLYEHKPLSEITVKQITNAADYNRGTFYLYFDNIQQVLDLIEDDLINDMVGDVEPENMLSFMLLRRPLGEELESFSKIFDEHRRYLVVLFGDNGDPAFARKLKNAIKDKLVPVLQVITSSSAQACDYALEYILSGEIGLLTQLFSEGSFPDADDARLAEALEIIRVSTDSATGL
jgi:AcrR family transcriptional regulator